MKTELYKKLENSLSEDRQKFFTDMETLLSSLNNVYQTSKYGKLFYKELTDTLTLLREQDEEESLQEHLNGMESFLDIFDQEEYVIQLPSQSEEPEKFKRFMEEMHKRPGNFEEFKVKNPSYKGKGE